MTRAHASHSWFLLLLMARQLEEKTPPGTSPDIFLTSHFTVVSGHIRYYIVEKTLVVTAKHGGKDGAFIVK